MIDINVILFDGSIREDLLPLTYTRPVADLRIGILTIREKWHRYLNTTSSTLTQDYLSNKYPLLSGENNLLINGAILPDENLLHAIHQLEKGQALVWENTVIAAITDSEALNNFSEEHLRENSTLIAFQEPELHISNLWHLFQKNGEALEADFKLLTNGRSSASISNSNKVIGAENVFVEEGATIECAILNADTGPIYIAKDAEIMEGSVVRGPFAMCEHAVLKMSSKIYGPTTIGPHCKVGGEVNNVVFTGYSNKGHDGFLGNSVLGEWVNLGADTNTSNLKNNYANVRLWSYPKGSFEDTGLQFCGLVVGDHSKCGINTMFNTGTVVGVFANIFGSGFPRNFVPSFSWGGANGFTTYKTNKAFEVAERVMARRSIDFDEQEKAILKHVFEHTSEYRVWEKKEG